MKNNDYFQNALSNFIFGMTEFGTICHLADHSYTVKQIMEHLDIPVSYQKVQQTVWKHMLEQQVLLLQEPCSSKFQDIEKNISLQAAWHEIQISDNSSTNLIKLLSRKCRENGFETAYISCDYGILKEEDPEKYAVMLQGLDNRQKDYIEGLPWESKRVYHCMNSRMAGIIYSILQYTQYTGNCYFMKLGEKISLS